MAKNHFFQEFALFSLLSSLALAENLSQNNSNLPCLNPEIFKEGEYELQNETLLLKNNLTITENNYEFNGSQVRVCLCKLTPCLRKCCPAGEIYNLSKRKCEIFGNSTNFELGTYNEELLVNDSSKFQKVYGLKCPNKKFRIKNNGTSNGSVNYFHIQENGFLHWQTVFLASNDIKINIFDSDIFCLEEFVRNQTSPFLGAFACFPKIEKEQDVYLTEFTLYPIGMIISTPFLLITILTYALIPELKNIHGKFLICYTTSLLNLFLFLIIIQIHRGTMNPTFCAVCGYIIQFSFLATFFWLNVMCFDIWWTFSEFRGIGKSNVTSSKKDLKKFLIYSIYGWGGPIVMLIITLTLDLHPDIPDYIIKANVGKTRCIVDVDNQLPGLIYFHGPAGVLLFLNTFFFLWTITKIFLFKIKSKTILSGEESRQSKESKRQFKMYLKLFVMMGINWMAEFISWAVKGPNWIWWATDVLNSLQGIFIFMIFVNRARIKKLILLKLCPSLIQQDGTIATFLTSSRSSSKKNSDEKNIAELKLMKRKNEGDGN